MKHDAASRPLPSSAGGHVTSEAVPDVERHTCPDETASVVNGMWVCHCPGGPYPFVPPRAAPPQVQGLRVSGVPVSVPSVTPTPLASAMERITQCAQGNSSFPWVDLSRNEAAALLARLDAADKLAEFLVNLRAESTGVAGYHLNGNIAEWDEFEEMNLLVAYRAPQSVAEGEE